MIPKIIGLCSEKEGSIKLTPPYPLQKKKKKAKRSESKTAAGKTIYAELNWSARFRRKKGAYFRVLYGLLYFDKML